MNALLVRTAAEKLGIRTERVFGLAFEWAEIPKSRKYIMNTFLDWYYTGIINPIVEDFILDVLSNRVTRKEIPK